MWFVVICDPSQSTGELTCSRQWFPETKNKTLEEIAAAFGDKVVTLTEQDVATETAVFKAKAKTEYGEDI